MNVVHGILKTYYRFDKLENRSYGFLKKLPYGVLKNLKATESLTSENNELIFQAAFEEILRTYILPFIKNEFIGIIFLIHITEVRGS